jgi:hypothetical protein
VRDLQEEIPGLGEVVAFAVTPIYAFVKENNRRAYVKERDDKERQPRGDRSCQLGVKKSTTKEQADGSKKEEKEDLWGSGSGVASATAPVYGDVVLAEYPLPFNENDVTSFFPLSSRAVATLGWFPTHLTADAAFDAWYVYQLVARRGGIAAIPLNQHGHPDSQRDHDGVPFCSKGLRMAQSFQFNHTRGSSSQRFLCPLLFPRATGACCDHEQFKQGPGCRKELKWELGGQMRVQLDGNGPLSQAIDNQRTSTERSTRQSKALGLKRPNVRQLDSIRNLNTLTYLVINVRALRRGRKINTELLSTPLKRLA